jgi:predicted transcriptional regulator
MPKARIHMSKVREIIRLHEARMSVHMISRALKVSRPVVDTYLKMMKNSDRRKHDPRHETLLKRLPDIVPQLSGKHVTRELV